MSNKSNPDFAAVIPAYQIIASRRLGYDTLMWQVPALSFTAQSFLFTIALGTSPNVARLIAASLALIAALLSIQLMAKQRYHEIIDAKLLENLEKEMKLDELIGYCPHEHPKLRARHIGMIPKWCHRLSSYQVWMVGLTLFAIASAGIIVNCFAILVLMFN
jgi:hypothetical protein